VPGSSDRGELGLGVALDRQGPLQQVGVVLLQPGDLGLLARRAEEAAALGRHRQAGPGDDLLAALAVIAPLQQGVPVHVIEAVQPLLTAEPLPDLGSCGAGPHQAVFLAGIQPDGLDDVGVGPPLLAGLEADGPYDPLAAPEHVRRWVGLQDELVLRDPLVLQASGAPAVGQRGQRAGVQALLLQRAVGGPRRLVADGDDWRKPTRAR
jgi:hypothetical protein